MMLLRCHNNTWARVPRLARLRHLSRTLDGAATRVAPSHRFPPPAIWNFFARSIWTDPAQTERTFAGSARMPEACGLIWFQVLWQLCD